MFSPVNAAASQDFRPYPKTPAICLTDNLPPNARANCLLLSAGDPRHVLYTIFREKDDRKVNSIIC
jgi:hypothetical protein